MELQEIFNKVRNHLRQQGRAATNRYGSCQYRGDGGTACAVGCLIPDEKYRPEMEVLSLRSFVVNFPDALPFVVRVNSPKFALLNDLQNAHDNHKRTWPKGSKQRESLRQS